MSDALTDIARDKEREDILSKIGLGAKEFELNPSTDKAYDLIRLWERYMNVGPGYWGKPNEIRAKEQISILKRYLKTWVIEKIDVPTETDPDVFDRVISIGVGFVVGKELENWIIKNLYPYKKYRIILKKEKVEEVSCKDCPLIGSRCIGCQSRNREEMAERMRKIREWDQ